MALTKDKLSAVGFPPEQASQLANGIPSMNADLQAIVALTAATGTTGNTVADVGGSFSQTTLNNNFKVLADKVNAILAQLKA
jgi:hypothetical protein